MADPNAVSASFMCICGNTELVDGGDGYFFCSKCGSMPEDMMDTGVADEDFIAESGRAVYTAQHSRRRPSSSVPIKTEPISQLPFSIDTDAPVEPRDHVGPTEPSDFGQKLGNGLSNEDYCKSVRMTYVYGLQLMINDQCKALVEKFNVSPLICGISGSIWLRYLKSTRVFDDEWGDEVELESQFESQGCNNKKYTKKTGGKFEPRNSFNQRMVVIWYRSLRRKIPLSSTLAIAYLSCHVAREPVLPTDIHKWCLEGKLPYLTAFSDIEKRVMSSGEYPLSASFMFRPSGDIPLHKLESFSAQIAQSVGLALPPVNFYAIASRYLSQLSLPVEKILPHACCIQEWLTPPGLWLSTSELRFPTRVCVMGILIVAIRILYDLNGFGRWEASLSENEVIGSNVDHEEDDLTSVHKFKDEAPRLLRQLEKRFGDTSANQEDALLSFLQHCKDVVFGGLKQDPVEEKMIDKFWSFYKDPETRTNERVQTENEDSHDLEDSIRSLDDIHIESPVSGDECENPASCTSPDRGEASTPLDRDTAIRQMKLQMEENRFCYIPPRERVKRLDYLHYVRKRDDGSLTYAAHADYFILLRACAKEAQVDVRVMHQGVMSLERRLAWIEKRIDHCLKEFES